MADKKIAFPFQDQLDIINAKCGFVIYGSTFTSGTSKTTDSGLEDVEVGTLVKDSASKVYFVTAINSSTYAITALALN